MQVRRVPQQSMHPPPATTERSPWQAGKQPSTPSPLPHRLFQVLQKDEVAILCRQALPLGKGHGWSGEGEAEWHGVEAWSEGLARGFRWWNLRLGCLQSPMLDAAPATHVAAPAPHLSSAGLVSSGWALASTFGWRMSSWNATMRFTWCTKRVRRIPSGKTSNTQTHFHRRPSHACELPSPQDALHRPHLGVACSDPGLLEGHVGAQSLGRLAREEHEGGQTLLPGLLKSVAQQLAGDGGGGWRE